MLIHDGDMFGIVSTGPSSLAIDLTYDRKRLDRGDRENRGERSRAERHPRCAGWREWTARSPLPCARRVLDGVRHHGEPRTGPQPPQGVHLREQRLRLQPVREDAAKQDANKYATPSSDGSGSGSGDPQGADDANPFAKQGNEFADADLASELSYLTRAANRANATIYTIDPRGLVGGPDLDENVDQVEWQDYVRKSQDSLRVLAEQTGGIAVVNQNDFTKALKRIDNETSDYYVIGYSRPTRIR